MIGIDDLDRALGSYLDTEALAPAPLELVTPATPSAAVSASNARPRSSAGSGSMPSVASRKGSSPR